MEKIGKYEVRKALGRGAVGAVFEAVDPETGLEVAVKLLTAASLEKPDLRERFLRTARAMVELEHPNLARVLEVGEHQGHPFVAMELLRGSDLAQVIGSRRTFPIEWSLDAFRQMCEGLAHAHRNGLLHLDLKPSDFRFDNATGAIKLLDFGVAHLKPFDRLEAGPARGGVFYRAPEQVEGRRPNGRADIFSVGAIVFELITRHKPFAAADTPTVLFKITHGHPDPRFFPETSFSPGLETIVLKALARDPRERYRSLEELHEDLVTLVRETAPRLRATPADVVGSLVVEVEEPAEVVEPTPPPAPAPRPVVKKLDKEALLEELTKARAEGQLPRALKICDRILLLDPEDEEVRRRAVELESVIQDQAVEQLCSQALSYAADGDIAQATRIAEKVERLAPWSPRYLQLQVYLDEEAARLSAQASIDRAQERLLEGSLDDASAAAEEAMAIHPTSASARRILDQVASLRGEPPAEAMEPGPEVERSPAEERALVLEERLVFSPREAAVESLTSTAVDHFVHDDHPRARAAVEEALALDPQNQRALDLLTVLGTLT